MRLITLQEASQIVFGGKVSPAMLKAQWRKGRLQLSKIGRSHFAPVSAFKEMVVRCQHERNDVLEKLQHRPVHSSNFVEGAQIMTHRSSPVTEHPLSIVDTIRDYLQNRYGTAAVQMSADGIERIYYNGVALRDLADALTPAAPAQCAAIDQPVAWRWQVYGVWHYAGGFPVSGAEPLYLRSPQETAE